MDADTFKGIVDEFLAHLEKTLIDKGNEYTFKSGPGPLPPRPFDRLEQFKEMGRRAHDHPLKCLQMAKMKHDTTVDQFIEELAAGYDGRTLPQWKEHLMDQAVYCILAWAMVKEEKAYKGTGIGAGVIINDIYCSVCGNLVSVVDKSCKHCGAELGSFLNRRPGKTIRYEEGQG